MTTSGGTTQPLHGRCVLLTRREAESTALRSGLEDLGARVTFLPTTSRKTTAADSPELSPLGEPERYTHVVFTSRPAATIFAELIQTRFGATQGPGILASWNERHVAAVGSGTRRAVEAIGLSVQTTAAPAAISRLGGGAALAKALLEGQHVRRGDRVALPQSRIAGPELEQRLAASGATVDRIPLYDTVTAAPSTLGTALAEWNDEEREPDAVVFQSPSAVRGFLELTGERGQARLEHAGLRVITIGVTTSAALEARGITVAAQAARPDAEAIIDAVTRALRSP